MTMNLTRSYIYHHNINAKNKIHMFPFTYSDINVLILNYIYELKMDNIDDITVIVEHSHQYNNTVRKIFI
jgi:hypothetical protein